MPLLMLVVLSLNPAWACLKHFQSFKLSQTALEGLQVKFNENEFGPQLDGIKFISGRRTATAIFFHAKKKEWCGVSRDSKEGLKFDCGFFKTGVTRVAGANSNSHAYASIDDDHVMTIHSLTKWDPRDPEDNLDPEKLKIVILPKVEVGETTTSELEVRAVDPQKDMILGRAIHTVAGDLRPTGEIVRATPRSGDSPKIKEPLETFSLVGSFYEGPSQCGPGSISEYKPAPANTKRMPAQKK